LLDENNTCSLADWVVQQCTRDCLNESTNNCVQCTPGCIGMILYITITPCIGCMCHAGGIMDDECGSNGTDSCGMDSVCVAKGKFATRECYDSGRLY